MEKITIKKLFNKKDCYGWVYHVEGRQYYWQNDNDLGLLADINDATFPETIIKKIPVVKGKYIYQLKNVYGKETFEGCTATLPAIIAIIKEAHGHKLTPHEEMLARRYW